MKPQLTVALDISGINSMCVACLSAGDKTQSTKKNTSQPRQIYAVLVLMLCVCVCEHHQGGSLYLW